MDTEARSRGQGLGATVGSRLEFRTSAIVLGEKAKICFGILTASLGSLHKSNLLVITYKSNLITCLNALLQKYLITSQSSTADLLVNIAFHVSNIDLSKSRFLDLDKSMFVFPAIKCNQIFLPC